MNYPALILAVGVVGIGAYLVINSTSQSAGSCAWYDLPCQLASVADQATNEINTALIIIGLIVVAIIGLLAFGPSTQHLAGAAALL
jgi:hypothetical protein